VLIINPKNVDRATPLQDVFYSGTHTYYARIMSSELPLTFQLGPGIPAIGLGTFQPDAAHPSVVKKAVLDALNAGYRHIDTAYMYGDGTVERAVGEALREWAGPREKVFVVSKL
jgi:diketogulonate reductase-like aldo/keto reductase